MPNEIFERGKARNELVIVLHGLRGSPTKMRGVVNAAAAACPDADILAIGLAFGGFLGALATKPAELVAAKVVKRIDRAIKERDGDPAGGDGYQRFTLVGHSFGGVIARKVAIIANGERPEAVFEPLLTHEFRQAREWGSRIERIVLLAGMSRGWSPASSRDWWTAAKWTTGSWLGELLVILSFGYFRLTSFGIRQGAPFIVQTRLQWLALARTEARPDRQKILGVQLLGAADDLVAPDDSVDFACDLGGVRTAPFVLIELPFATHDNAYVMKEPTPHQRELIKGGIDRGNLSEVCKREELEEQVKWELLGRALTTQPNHFADIEIDPNDMSDTPALQPDNTVTHFVFVIHGIRDHGFWTQKIARVIKREAKREHPDGKHQFHSFTGSYGYFAMVPFVLPWIRRWKSEWLMDHYVEVCARYPKAAISFVGHSNGTYLLARAFDDYPAAHFKRVVLAGSVIRRDFNWSRLLARGTLGPPRVVEVLNYVATHDWVVAIFSKAFQPFRFFDLGSAGHDGFDQHKAKICPRALHESHYIEGSHSAALTETQWDDIARFIVKGGPIPGLPDGDFQDHRRWWMVASGWISTFILVAVVGLVIGLGVTLAKCMYVDGVWHPVIVLFGGLYWWGLYIFTTRF